MNPQNGGERFPQLPPALTHTAPMEGEEVGVAEIEATVPGGGGGAGGEGEEEDDGDEGEDDDGEEGDGDGDGGDGGGDLGIQE